MSFGALILVQDKPNSDVFVPLEGFYKDAITEVRVEQHLDKQTSFAIRFQEDFANTEEIETIQRYFAKSRGMAICVPEAVPDAAIPPKLVCLVRGQVENQQFDITIGGSGSSFEIRGQDTRTLINRVVKTRRASGASDVVITKLVKPCANEVDVGPSIKNYFKKKIVHRYSGSELDAVNDFAKKCNFSFWLTYELEDQGDGAQLIKVIANVKSSPDRHEKEKTKAPTDLSDLGLIPGDATAQLRILGTQEACETVANFSVSIDSEVFVTALSSGQDIDFGGEDETEATTQADDLNSGENASKIGSTEPSALDWGEPKPRSVKVSRRGDPEIAKWLAYAAATEASWYVKAEALTSMHMIKQALAPHDIVEVVGGGCGIAGKYQVSDVTHVINPAEHWMELKLRSNSRNLDDKPALP
jgi:hypothetical protein